MLSRGDLPDDFGERRSIVETRGRPAHDTFPGQPARRSHIGTAVTLIAAVVVAIALAAAVWLATSVTQRGAGGIAAVVVAVPLVLLLGALLASLVGRRRHR